jgi:hypothetical protein
MERTFTLVSIFVKSDLRGHYNSNNLKIINLVESFKFAFTYNSNCGNYTNKQEMTFN